MSSLLELLVAILLAAGAITFVLRPVFVLPPTLREPEHEGAGADPEDDLSPRTVALRALKEIEFDRATGKLTDADYEALKRRYTEEALQALRAGPAESSPPGAAVPAAPPPPPAGSAGGTCPTHGARPERDAAFCSACGRRLEAAPGFCSRCGSVMGPDARFCSACGQRVAA